MNTNVIDAGIRHMATASISGYQRYISPHKGFSCAHRLLHGGESCSQFVKRMISQHGLVDAMKASRQRFKACRAANQTLRAKIYQYRLAAQASENEPEEKRKNNGQSCALSESDCQPFGDCVDGTFSCGTIIGDLTTADCAALSCDLPDCGSTLDCSGLDCSGLDCGSCG